MTNEDAIKELKTIQDNMAPSTLLFTLQYEALNMAISALGKSEAISNLDAISRTAACKIQFQDGLNEDGVIYVRMSDVFRHIRTLPPVNTEPKKGEWISSEDNDEWYSCSQCHRGLTMFDGTYDFCPHCGAKMENKWGKYDKS